MELMFWINILAIKSYLLRFIEMCNLYCFKKTTEFGLKSTSIGSQPKIMIERGNLYLIESSHIKQYIKHNEVNLTASEKQRCILTSHMIWKLNLEVTYVWRTTSKNCFVFWPSDLLIQKAIWIPLIVASSSRG